MSRGDTLENNEILKKLIRDRGLKQWKVAEQAGVSEQTLVRWLRTRMSSEREKKVVSAVVALCGGAEYGTSEL